VIAGDLDSLKSYFRAQGVEPEDLDELDDVVSGYDPEDLNNEQSPIRRWIDIVAGKVSVGGKELAKTAARELTLLSVRYYFGDVTAAHTAHTGVSSP
jgi:hypothetical protein